MGVRELIGNTTSYNDRYMYVLTLNLEDRYSTYHEETQCHPKEEWCIQYVTCTQI